MMVVTVAGEGEVGDTLMSTWFPLFTLLEEVPVVAADGPLIPEPFPENTTRDKLKHFLQIQKAHMDIMGALIQREQ